MGAILLINGRIEEFIADPLTQLDVDRFGSAIGDCIGRQTWEKLAVLVALRAWAHR